MKNFNLRVYGLIINENQEILLSDEYRFGHFFTKFPGGGVEKGEGIIDALHREFQEELSLEILDATPFYFNDFYQESAFQKEDQIVSFYYLVQCDTSKIKVETYVIPFQEETEKQRWISIADLSLNNLTFPIDKIVVDRIKTFIHEKKDTKKEV
jgi:ADP-ribose pyrophosphatase YjhB (NUDIX family)